MNFYIVDTKRVVKAIPTKNTRFNANLEAGNMNISYSAVGTMGTYEVGETIPKG